MPYLILLTLGITPPSVPGAILTFVCCPHFTLKAVLVWVINYMVVSLITNLEGRYQNVTILTSLMRELRF